MNVGMFNLSFKRMLLLPILTCVLAACGGGNDNKVAVEESGGQVIVPAEEMNILQVLEADTGFSRFLGSLELAGLTDRFADTSRQFTIFVPNNSAFDLLGDISGLTNDQLNSLLLYHVLDNQVDGTTIASLKDQLTFTENSQAITYKVDDSNNLYINDAQIVITDIVATNGIVHVLSEVLAPELDPKFLWTSFDETELVAHENVPSALFSDVGSDTYIRFFYGHNLDKSIATDVGAGDVSGHWQAGTDSDPYPYQVWIPEAQTESMPLVLILHTRGEQGDDNNAQIITELASTWANNVEEPSILLAPQAPSGTGAWSVTDLDNIIYEIQSNYNIDLNRLYITGHSFGGRGVLNMLSGSDHKFAAATLFAPSGKGFDDLDTSTLGETPQWYVVSKSDVIVDDEAVYNYFLEVYASDSQ